MSIKRLGIFAMYDAEGIADDYIIYLLKSIKPFISNIIVVSDGTLDENSVSRLSEYAEVLINDKGGYDSGSYKFAIDKYGWDYIQKFDELILFNDSNYGPIYPLSEMFDRMDNTDCDFWTLTYQEEFFDKFTKKNVPAHYRSDFYVFRNNILQSTEFISYWRNLQPPVYYQEAVHKYEFALTKLLQNFNGTSYIKKEKLDTHKEVTSFPITILSDHLFIINSKIPFIKRKVFTLGFSEKLIHTDTSVSVKILKHIRNNTDYDENLILKHLIRICDPVDMKEFMGLNFVFPVNICPYNDILKNKKIGIIMHLYYTDLLEYCFQYIRKIPESINVIITTKADNVSIIKSLFEQIDKKNYQIVLPQNCGREVSAVLVACSNLIKKYEYLCVVHDKKSNKLSDAYIYGQTFMDILWDNSVTSEEYITNVINCFEENPLLGVLVPPPPYHGEYFITGNMTWCGNFNKTKKLANQLGLKCIISEDKQPYTIGGTYWCRTDALKPLFEYSWKYDDFDNEPMSISGTFSHAIERIYSYVAQNNGYMTGIMMSDEYANTCVSNYQTMLQNIVGILLIKSERNFFNYDGLLKTIIYNNSKLIDFADKYESVYIYGITALTESLISELKEKVNGVIISDGFEKEDCSVPVYYFSEIEFTSDTGVVIALLTESNRTLIKEKLNKIGFFNIF